MIQLDNVPSKLQLSYFGHALKWLHIVPNYDLYKFRFTV